MRCAPLLVAGLLAAGGCGDRASTPDCVAAIDHSMAAVRDAQRRAGVPGEIDALELQMKRSCVDDAWSADVRRCLRSTAGPTEPEACLKQLTGEQIASLNRRLDRHSSDPGTTIDASDLAACRSYTRAIERLTTCDAIGQEARDAFQMTFGIMRDTWRETPVARSDEAERVCRYAERALASTVGPTCGW